MGSTRRRFTDEYKAAAVELVLANSRNIADVARSIDVHEMTYSTASSGSTTGLTRSTTATSTARFHGEYNAGRQKASSICRPESSLLATCPLIASRRGRRAMTRTPMWSARTSQSCHALLYCLALSTAT